MILRVTAKRMRSAMQSGTRCTTAGHSCRDGRLRHGWRPHRNTRTQRRFQRAVTTHFWLERRNRLGAIRDSRREKTTAIYRARDEKGMLARYAHGDMDANPWTIGELIQILAEFPKDYQ